MGASAGATFVLSERRLDDGTDLLSLEGATTPASAARVKARLADARKRKQQRVIVDLSRVSFVDSGLVEVLASAARDSKRAKFRLVVVEPVDPMTARPLEMSRLDLVADVAPTLREAAKRVGLPEDSIRPPRSATPAAPLAEPSRPKRTLLGRRKQDQDITQELAQLRRFAQELRRESGMHEQLATEELARRRAAEEALVRSREAEARARAEAGDADAGADADELGRLRARMEEARGQATRALAESERMEEEAEAAHARIQALEAEIAALRAGAAAAGDADEARAEAARMEEEAEAAHARIQVLEAEVEQARAEATRAAADLDAAGAVADGLRSELAAAQAAAAGAAASHDDLAVARAAADHAEQEAEAAHAHAQQLESRLEKFRMEAAVPGVDVNAIRAEADRAEEEAEAAHARAQALETDLKAARDALAAAEAEAGELRGQLDEVRAALEDEREARRAAAEADAAAAAAQASGVRRQADHDAAEEAPRREEEEQARQPRPKVPVWADPTPINLNTADLEELMLLPGIGKRPAERILSFREERGSFGAIEELWEIPDFPTDRLSRIRQYVRV